MAERTRPIRMAGASRAVQPRFRQPRAAAPPPRRKQDSRAPEADVPADRHKRASAACSLRASALIEAVVRAGASIWPQDGGERRRRPDRELLLSPETYRRGRVQPRQAVGDRIPLEAVGKCTGSGLHYVKSAQIRLQNGTTPPITSGPEHPSPTSRFCRSIFRQPPLGSDRPDRQRADERNGDRALVVVRP